MKVILQQSQVHKYTVFNYLLNTTKQQVRYYKSRQVLLQIATDITNCDRYYKLRRPYKLRRYTRLRLQLRYSHGNIQGCDRCHIAVMAVLCITMVMIIVTVTIDLTCYIKTNEINANSNVSVVALLTITTIVFTALTVKIDIVLFSSAVCNCYRFCCS